MSLATYPPIDHGVYNGVDTGDLEAKMQEIDWHNDRQPFTIYGDKEPELKVPVEEIVSQINRISQGPGGLFNLLCGRAILNTNPLHKREDTGTWMKLDLSHKDENGN